LLKMAVGVDVRQRGPLGSQTDISIRANRCVIKRHQYLRPPDGTQHL
jgi:hypothetical protein